MGLKEDMYLAVGNRLGQAGVSHVKRLYRSTKGLRTIMKSLTFRVAEGKALLITPYYWAYYVHEGRGPSKGNIIYYLNSRHDPRVKGGFPVTKAEAVARRFTQEEFVDEMIKDNSRAARGLPRRMVVTEYVRETKPRHFFNDAMLSFVPPADVEKAAIRVVESYLKTLGGRTAQISFD